MDIMYFLRVLYRKKWIIFILSFLAVVVTFLLLVNKKPQFVSVAQFSTGFTSEKVKLSDGSSAIDLYTVDIRFDNVLETMKSPQVVNRVGYALLLHDLNDPANAYSEVSLSNKQKPVYREMNVDTAKRILVEKLANHDMLHSNKKQEALLIEYLKLFGYEYKDIMKHLTVSRVARTDYLDIIYSSINADLSAKVVNMIGQEFLNYYRNLNTQRTDDNAQTIRDMVNVQQSKVDSLGRLLLEAKVSQGSLDPVARTTSAMETVTEIESRLAEENGKYNTHLNRVAYLRAQLSSLMGSAETTSGDNQEVIRLTQRRNDLVAELNKRGGNDLGLQRQIDGLRNEIIQKSSSGASRSKLLDKIDNTTREINEEEALLNASKTTIDEYNARITRYMSLTNVNPGSSVQIDVLKTKLDMENQQLREIREKYSMAEGLVRDDPTVNFIQTRVGIPPNQPESKKTLIKMILAGMSVFLLMVLIFIFLEIFDPAAKTPSIFYRQSRTHTSNILNHVLFKKKLIIDMMLEDKQGKKYRFKNLFKNSIRKLRFELLDSGKKVFLLTSSQKQSGKTTTIEALAASLLLSHKKVLIIDLNFLNNTLTRHFNPEIFIQDVSSKINYSLSISQQKVVSSTSYDGLDIIGCRESNVTPTEVLNELNIVDFLRLLREEYDYILIETAAMNLYADSREMAKYVDSIYLIFGADEAIAQADLDSIQFVASLKEKNGGVILNKVLTENLNA
ncbi:MAG: hypothetical protein KF829_08695 [Ferruginibacter sp.]|nr:hypothetical protein [Ferruginibacter sp.]